jgi:hypothetical protein
VVPARSIATTTLGAPDGNFFSLGFGGRIDLEFLNEMGGTITISPQEITNGTYPLETAEVFVSENGTSWTSIGTANNNSGAGDNPHGTTLPVPAEMCVKFVRLVDTTDSSIHTNDADAFDVDAVRGDYTDDCPEPPPPPPCGCDGDDVVVKNKNKAVVINKVESKSDTGENWAGGSKGGKGGNGGDIGGGAEGSTTGNGGNGGNGGTGGTIETGNAHTTAGAVTVANTNITRIGGEGCGCEGGGDVKVKNRNKAFVWNDLESKADTGDNKAGGSKGGKGGNGGDIEGGNEVEGTDTGDGGAGGEGGEGGFIQTGEARSRAGALTIVNTNRTRH